MSNPRAILSGLLVFAALVALGYYVALPIVAVTPGGFMGPPL